MNNYMCNTGGIAWNHQSSVSASKHGGYSLATKSH